jgi:hypothetical protein
MNYLENPLSFIDIKKYDNHYVEITNQVEICQGGPVIGDLVIDGRKLENLQFGGPIWLTKKGIVAPIVERGFFYSGFRLSLIDYKSGIVKKIGSRHDIVWIVKCEDDIARCSIHLDGSDVFEYSIE